jgi:Xaa-Pro aminopeptidase
MFGSGMASLLNSTFLLARPADAARALQYLRAIKTPYEVDRIRAACTLAATTYRDGARMLRAGMTEIEAVVPFRIPLFDGTTAGATRRDGFVFCMSGPNGAEAYRSYQRSRDRRLDSGDFVLVHCNSYLDGYWTDITRTFLLGPADDRSRDLLDAIAEARRAAIDAVRPGARAADVDRAARDVLSGRGFAEEFKHPTGHGVGFLAIDHNAWPCLHPASADVLESGMVFNVEPGIYFDGIAGLRHCDMVAVTADGCELLTPFLLDPADLILE